MVKNALVALSILMATISLAWAQAIDSKACAEHILLVSLERLICLRKRRSRLACIRRRRFHSLIDVWRSDCHTACQAAGSPA
jgi:hypothetical protein